MATIPLPLIELKISWKYWPRMYRFIVLFHLNVFINHNVIPTHFSKVKGTQSRILNTSLSGKSAMNLIKLTFTASSSRSCPPSSTSRNTTAHHTDFSVFTSQCLLHCTISLASCLYWACSVTSFFSVRLFFKLVYGK